MTENARMGTIEDRVKATGNQFEGRAKQAIADMTGDQGQQADEMLDKAMGKLKDWKAKEREMSPAKARNASPRHAHWRPISNSTY